MCVSFKFSKATVGTRFLLKGQIVNICNFAGDKFLLHLFNSSVMMVTRRTIGRQSCREPSVTKQAGAVVCLFLF